MWSNNDRIFSGRPLWDEIEERKRSLIDAIRSASKEQLQGGSDEESAAWMAQSYLFPEDGAEIDYGHRNFDSDEVDFNEGQGFTRRVQRFKIFVPVSGHLEVFSYKPMSGPAWYPDVKLDGRNLIFMYLDAASQGGDFIAKQFERDLSTIREGVSAVESKMSETNGILRRMGVNAVAQRRAELERQSEAAKGLGMPRRE